MLHVALDMYRHHNRSMVGDYVGNNFAIIKAKVSLVLISRIQTSQVYFATLGYRERPQTRREFDVLKVSSIMQCHTIATPDAGYILRVLRVDLLYTFYRGV